MSLGRTTLELWKRAPAWRFAIFGALIASVLAAVTARGPSGAGTQTASGTPPSGQTAPAPGGGGNSGAQQAQSCGPQGQTTMQAPIVVSQTGQVPSNVQGGSGQVTQSGVSAEVQARFVQFSTRVDAALRDQRTGEQCVKMQGALDVLQASDFAWADCFQEGQAKLVRAQECSGDLANSDARFERLTTAFEQAREDNSAGPVERLADARAVMTRFDQTREAWNARSDAVAAGDDATAAITQSDRRIDQLDQLVGRTGSGLAELQAFAAVADITALDRTRLNPAQADVLEKAHAARQQFAESDARLGDLSHALTGNAAGDDEARAALIAAISDLRDIDVQRATAEQQAEIAQAREAAAGFALHDLVTEAARTNLAEAPPAIFERLRDLRALVLQYGGQIAPESDGAAALDLARRAEVQLAQSDLRLAQMRDVVRQVRSGGPAELGASVVDAHEKITRFDIARMSDEDTQTYQDLGAAREVTLATRRQELTRQVPIFLKSDGSGTLADHALEQVRVGLQARGFNLVQAQEQSAVTFVFALSPVEEKKITFSGSSVNSAEVSLSVSGSWTFAGQSIQVPGASGDAVGNAVEGLRLEAVSEAARRVVEEIAEMAGE